MTNKDNSLPIVVISTMVVSKAMLNRKSSILGIIVVIIFTLVISCFLSSSNSTDIFFSPKPENINYSGYDALISRVRYVRINGGYLESDNFSHRFYSQFTYDTPGYMISDIDNNGVDELIFGANTDGWDNGAWDGIIYDIYTIVDGEVFHVICGGERSRYHFCENGCIAQEYSNSAFDHGYNYYIYNDAKLTLVESVIYNYSPQNQSPWFYSIGDTFDVKTAERITPDKARKIIDKYVYEYPEYIPFIE